MNIKKPYSDNVNYNLNIFLLTNSILFSLDNGFSPAVIVQKYAELFTLMIKV